MRPFCCRSLSSMLVILVLGLLLSGPAQARDYRVDQANPVADDGGPGSAEKPFKTISKAVAVAQAGDTVLVNAGTYGEVVEFKNSGTAEQPIVLKAAPGQRVVVSGAREIKGWRKCTQEDLPGNSRFDQIYVATVESAPRILFQNGVRLRLSRWPANGRHPAEGGTAGTLIDATHLTQPAGAWVGGTLNVRIEKIRSARSARITAYDAARHELTVDKPWGSEIVPGKDVYWIENVPAMIDEPGDFACDTTVKPARLLLWPLEGTDPEKQPPLVPVRGPKLVTWAEGVGHLKIDGLEIAYATENGIGSSAKGGHHVEIVNCILHHDGHAGLGLYNQSDITLRHCLALGSDYGVSIGTSKNILIEECELFSNLADAISVAKDSDNIRLVRNYLHDQWWDNHPDGLQVFAKVTNLLVDSNLIMNTGQGVQTSDTDGAKFVNNILVGQHHAGINLGHNSTDNTEFAGNTVAFSGFHALYFSGKNGLVRNNVFLAGGKGAMVTAQSPGMRVDHNLYWKTDEVRIAVPEGQDQNSRFGDPKFRSAPPLSGRASFTIEQWDKGQEKLAKCTPGKFYLSGGSLTKFLQIGDRLEVNFDGLPRKVTEVTDDYVAFEPPLRTVHPYGWDFLVNWKDRSAFTWDLRLSDDSPGKKMGDQGQDVGSNIDMQAYMKGDFNSDGRRDLPELPADVRVH